VLLTASIGAATFATLAWALGANPALPAVLALAGFGIVLAPVDIACHRLPDPLVGTAFGLVSVLLLGASLSTGMFGPLARAGFAAVAMAGGYLVLALLPRAGLGFGDVKLAGVLGLLLGWLSWKAVLFGLLLPHLLNGPVAVALMLSGRARRDSAMPLGPALLAGAWLSVVGLAAWTRFAR
jgi:leader peptidase (prepilin peptidase)/N-methyltransferase